MHAFEEKAEKFINKHSMLSDGDRVVLGVSGGADSTALFLVMLALKEKYNLDITVVHINHMLREEASDEAETVRLLCSRNNIKYVLREYDVLTLSKEHKKSTEEMGRELRYSAFSEVLGDDSGKIAVAHNMNDQAETMLFNLFRGTGITGLSSIAPVRGRIIRPLLGVTREEIEEYLSEKGVSFCTDKSNFTNDYTRNRIRNNIIPVIRSDVSKRAVEHMANTAGQLRELDDFVNKCVKQAYETCLVSGGQDGIIYNRILFNKYDVYLKKMLIKRAIDVIVPGNRDITSAHIESVLNLPCGEGYKEVFLPYGLKGYVSYDEIGIRRSLDALDADIEISLNVNGETIVDSHRRFVSEYVDFSRFSNEQNIYTKYLNCDTINTQMLIRTRRSGDYIVVNEDGGRKKLKDYFIDVKVPSSERDKVLLVAEGSRILWVVGYRIGEDCKVTDKTEKILKITYITNNVQEGC